MHWPDVTHTDVLIAAVRGSGCVNSFGAFALIKSESGTRSIGFLISRTVLDVSHGVKLTLIPLWGISVCA